MPQAPNTSEALPVHRPDLRGPQGVWVIERDGARGFYADRYLLLDTPDDKPLGSLRAERLEHGSLEQLRAMLPYGLINLGRHPEHEPNVVEVWA